MEYNARKVVDGFTDNAAQNDCFVLFVKESSHGG